ncbi:MAG: HAD-IA family hydrolase [Bacteroidota bacterium]
MDFTAIIFDCDGVLVDSVGLGDQALVNILASRAPADHVMPLLHQYPGRKLQELFRLLEEELGIQLPTTFEADYRVESRRLFDQHLQAIPQVDQLLTQLSCPMAVASNGPLNKTRRNLRLTGLLHYFEPHVYSAYELQRWKPDPALFLHAASALGVPPTQCLVVEDSLPGIRAAQAGGFAVVAYAASGKVPGLLDPEVPVLKSIMDVLEL